jgi:hypothetical protein
VAALDWLGVEDGDVVGGVAAPDWAGAASCAGAGATSEAGELGPIPGADPTRPQAIQLG